MLRTGRAGGTVIAETGENSRHDVPGRLRVACHCNRAREERQHQFLARLKVLVANEQHRAAASSPSKSEKGQAIHHGVTAEDDKDNDRVMRTSLLVGGPSTVLNEDIKKEKAEGDEQGKSSKRRQYLLDAEQV